MQRDLELSNPVKLLAEVSRIVVGKDDLKELLLVALLAGGHVLVEGPPGTAKTLLCKTFAMAIGGEFKRVQCTPDMLPGDVTGFYMYRPDGTSHFIPGPIFGNVVMIDELNRATPRTQAAFLEGMQEGHVTLEGIAHALPELFMVIASQVPTGSEGTYFLPDTQLDRFMFRIESGYPDADDEVQVLFNVDNIDAADVLPVLPMEEIQSLRKRSRGTYVAPEVIHYVVAVMHGLRQNPDVFMGPSPRGSVLLYKAIRAFALVQERDYAIPDDVKRLASPCLEHRLVLRAEAQADGVTAASILQQTLEEIPVPKQFSSNGRD